MCLAGSLACGGDDGRPSAGDAVDTPTAEPAAPSDATAVPGAGATPVDTATPLAALLPDSTEWTIGVLTGPSTVDGGPPPVPVLSALRTGVHPDYERLTIELVGASGLPGYRIEYVDRPLYDCGSGEPTYPVGDAWLEIRLEPAAAHTEQGRPTLGARDLAVDQPLLQRIYRTCNFEAIVTHVLALSAPNPFRVMRLADPPRIVVDVRTASWPAPLAVARAFADRYPQTPAVSYIPALSWRGALRLAELTGDATWRSRTRAEMQPLLDGPLPEASAPLRLTSLAGYAAAAELGRVDGDEAAMSRARAVAALLMGPGGEFPAAVPGWTDDMFMAASLLTAVTGEGEADRTTMVGAFLTLYAQRLQRPDGLFIHALDAPHAWGRGNGFAALGLAEGLTHLANDQPAHAPILESFRRQMAAFVRHQSDDGSWRQVVDEPESYQELSVTAMAVTAMARGIRMGWLDVATYRPVVERGWQAVLGRIAPDGSVRDVCTSTGAGPTLEYYLERPAVSGLDDRGGGLVLTAALEMAELARS